MKNLFKVLLIVMLVVSISALVVMVSGPRPAQATTANPAPGHVEGYMMVPLHISSIGATNAGIVKWTQSWPCRLVGMNAAAFNNTGDTPTLTLDVTSDGTSVLANALPVAKGSISAANLATSPKLADEKTVSVNATVGAGNGTASWTDVSVMLYLKCQ